MLRSTYASPWRLSSQVELLITHLKQKREEIIIKVLMLLIETDEELDVSLVIYNYSPECYTN